jgi:hypothetical protein
VLSRRSLAQHLCRYLSRVDTRTLFNVLQSTPHNIRYPDGCPSSPNNSKMLMFLSVEKSINGSEYWMVWMASLRRSLQVGTYSSPIIASCTATHQTDVRLFVKQMPILTAVFTQHCTRKLEFAVRNVAVLHVFYYSQAVCTTNCNPWRCQRH